MLISNKITNQYRGPMVIIIYDHLKIITIRLPDRVQREPFHGKYVRGWSIGNNQFGMAVYFLESNTQ